MIDDPSRRAKVSDTDFWYSLIATPHAVCFADWMAGQGSGGNVLAALCSLFVPGLGQLLQGRVLMALVMFVLASVLWFFLLGWIIHLWSIVDAARFAPSGAAGAATS